VETRGVYVARQTSGLGAKFWKIRLFIGVSIQGSMSESFLGVPPVLAGGRKSKHRLP